MRDIDRITDYFGDDVKEPSNESLNMGSGTAESLSPETIKSNNLLIIIMILIVVILIICLIFGKHIKKRILKCMYKKSSPNKHSPIEA